MKSRKNSSFLDFQSIDPFRSWSNGSFCRVQKNSPIECAAFNGNPASCMSPSILLNRLGERDRKILDPIYRVFWSSGFIYLHSSLPWFLPRLFHPWKVWWEIYKWTRTPYYYPEVKKEPDWKMNFLWTFTADALKESHLFSSHQPTGKTVLIIKVWYIIIYWLIHHQNNQKDLKHACCNRGWTRGKEEQWANCFMICIWISLAKMFSIL